MNLQQRIDLLDQLGKYILSGNAEWQQVKERAGYENGWFIPQFVDLATNSIAENFLQKEIIERWLANYHLKAINDKPQTVGIVMAGNIPLVGFHDMLCVFITGHIAFIKPSSKDKVLIKHLVEVMAKWNDEINELIRFGDMLKGCDAYIATGSNNSAAHFEYYFRKYPHIIRRNRTSVAILSGEETKEELELLADDVYLYFGLGCRNVTKIFVPEEYDFVPLLSAFKKYNYMADHSKYKNNYDYNLAIHLLNKKFYMSNDSILLIEEASPYSPISQLNYEFYKDKDKLHKSLEGKSELQCIVGREFIPFGQAQYPAIGDYADGVDTISFLKKLAEGASDLS
ncbi:MAG: acyl-CoA reductase [Chitinophagaceae bacterium]